MTVLFGEIFLNLISSKKYRSKTLVDFAPIKVEEAEEEKVRSQKVRIQKKSTITRPRISKNAIVELKSIKYPSDAVQRIAGTVLF